MGKIVALIPARGGSKRIPNKNIRMVSDIPLVGHAIEQALGSDLIDEVYVSTDSKIIADVAKTYGAIVPFIRPSAISGDKSTDYEVFDHFLAWYEQTHDDELELIVQIRATSPIRSIVDINKAINIMLKKKKFDSLRSVSIPSQTPYKIWILEEDGSLSPVMKTKHKMYDLAGQNLPLTYAQDGVIDIVRPNTLKIYKNMSGEKIWGYIGHQEAQDIDTPKDLIKIENKIRSLPLFNNMKFLSGRIGTIQGRLSPSYSGELQSFPAEWKKEFELARNLNYGHIELFRDKSVNSTNPLWNWNLENKEVILETILHSAVPARAICDDFIMTCSWSKMSDEQMTKIIHLLSISNELNIKTIVYPLLETADISDSNERFAFCNKFKIIDSIAKVLNIKICLESNLSFNELQEIISTNNFTSTLLCIDTGNLFNEDIDAIKQILEAKNLIGHIHFKDRDMKGMNVPFGEGQINFKEILNSLRKINYSGFITFESSRGIDYLETAKKNLDFIKQKANSLL